MERVKIVGAGLAGSEIALQLASYGIEVTLYEMKPTRRTPAQTSDFFAELVCSNSFRSQNPANAIGQLKREMRAADSFIMAAADRHAVPAGDALAVDRENLRRRSPDSCRRMSTSPSRRASLSEFPTVYV